VFIFVVMPIFFMPEEKKKDSKTVEATLGLIVIVASFMYIYSQLIREQMLDVLIAVLAFGFGLILLNKYVK